MYPEYFARKTWTNSEDPDQMPQHVASDEGLNSFSFIQQF